MKADVIEAMRASDHARKCPTICSRSLGTVPLYHYCSSSTHDHKQDIIVAGIHALTTRTSITDREDPSQ
jgi:hypothetical protein